MELAHRVASPTEAFIFDCRTALGIPVVEGDVGYAHNVSGYTRAIPAVVRPNACAQVVAVVERANRYRVPLYPISTGRNWGFGSRLPVRDGCVILDLGALDRIREVDATHGYAVVEPGVTQGQLHDYLVEHEIPFFLDVTGAGPSTSVLGNTLDRGIAYNGLRCESVRALEVVLGNGAVVHTGFGHFAGARTKHLYTYGIGPHLDGLFMQSSYGVVTAATIDLIPLPEAQRSFMISFDAGRLGAFVDLVRALKQRGVLDCIPHIANRARTVQTVGPVVREELVALGLERRANEIIERHFGAAFTAVGAIRGERGLVRRAQKIVKRELSRIGKVRFLSPRALRFAHALAKLTRRRELQAVIAGTAPFRAMTRGVPSPHALRSVAAAAHAPTDASDPDLGAGGMLFCVPLAPLDRAGAHELVATAEGVCGSFGFEPAITLNALDTRVLEAVISIGFDRRDAERTTAAHRCLDALHRTYIASGLPPYRVGIDSMHHVVRDGDSFWCTVRELERVLDPQGIIAPGRYI
jgi:4-cresol dehydrogenase (hydroxylating)